MLKVTKCFGKEIYIYLNKYIYSIPTYSIFCLDSIFLIIFFYRILGFLSFFYVDNIFLMIKIILFLCLMFHDNFLSLDLHVEILLIISLPPT